MSEKEKYIYNPEEIKVYTTKEVLRSYKQSEYRKRKREDKKRNRLNSINISCN